MIQKQDIEVTFAQGLDQKTDPKQVPIGKFTMLENSIFTKAGLLQKRNGYGSLAALPDTSYSYLTTFNGNLTAIGPTIGAYSTANTDWVSKGSYVPLAISTLPLINNSVNQTQCDAVIAPNGLVCTVYTQTTGSATTYLYVIADSVTGQNIIEPTLIPGAAVTGSPRVFLLGRYFVIVFTNVLIATHLQYIAIGWNAPTVVTAPQDIAAAYIPSATVDWDGFVVNANDNLYIAYNSTTGGQNVSVTYLSAGQAGRGGAPVTPVTFPGSIATIMTVTADITTPQSPVIWVSFYDHVSATGATLAVDKNLNTILSPLMLTFIVGVIVNITSAAQFGVNSIYCEIANTYSYDATIPTNYIQVYEISLAPFLFQAVFNSGVSTITPSSTTGLVTGMFIVDNTTPSNILAGTTIIVSGPTLVLSANTQGASAVSPGDTLSTAGIYQYTLVRSVGLASKAFIIDGVIGFLATYQSPFQSTYFMINASNSTAEAPIVVAKVAYENGGGPYAAGSAYLPLGLPNVTVTNGIVAWIAYLFKDLIAAVNKNTNVPVGTQVDGIYSQTGIKLGTFNFTTTTGIDTSELGQNLNIGGGFGWMYDGYLPVEQDFFLFPDSIEATTHTTGGFMSAQQYFYQVTYEWTDNQGNAFRSAPSIPITVTTGSGTSSVTIDVPTLRLTYKVANPLKIVIYRWSAAQEVYYQVTSITVPILNETNIDSIAFLDTLADATILGDNILYTTGGVVEDTNPPAYNITTLFDTRQWIVDAEDPNLLWFSKQVIEGTPVEFSDLLTQFVAPNIGTSSSTGPITALAPMDDKLIIFKQDAIFYINGTGPDNTGANSQYSQPTFITSSVGCSNQPSITLMPMGLMFQSDKGIWLLGRDLSTTYIGAPVETYTIGNLVVSAVTVPETNQCRFMLNTGLTLMYDYYYQQWGSFVGVPCVSSCIFQSLHTFINSYGAVLQETPGLYIDGTNPVLMAFTTGPIRLGKLQNYQRSYFFYLLGTYMTPHKLQLSITYDYGIGPSQVTFIQPTNFSAAYGAGLSNTPYGQGNPYGGANTLEQWRVFLTRQRCMAMTLSLQEVYDGTYGVPAGAGLTLSGLNFLCGFKGKFRPQPASSSAGGGTA